MAASIPCGPDVGPVVEAARAYRDAGFTDLALVQVGDGGQEGFLDWAEAELLPVLRKELD